MNELFEIFSYAFMLRALLVGVMISLCAALVGTSLVLRHQSMLGDGLSHTAFGAFALATVLGFAPLPVALPLVILASIFILKFNQRRKDFGDVSIAVLSASSLAIGTILISVSRGVNIDLNSYLFGSILSVGWGDVLLCAILTFATFLLYLFAHHRIFAITFDEDFAKSIGIKTGLYDIIFAILCSLIVVLGMRLLGALLISSLIIFPTLTAMKLSKTFKGTIIISAFISLLAFIVGLVCSYFFATPTGATIVLVHLILLLVTKIIAK